MLKETKAIKPLHTVDIMMSVFNQENLIERTLGSIIDNTTTPFNLILVFDGCTDRTKEIALAFIKKNKPVLLRDLRMADAPNVFETKANNIGFKLATTDYILTVQDDVVIEEKGWERRLTWPIRAWDDVFAVTGRAAMNIIIGEDGILRDVDKAAREYLSLSRRSFAIRSAINRGPIAFRTDSLKKLGYLDEAFAPAQLDEVDLAMRAYELLSLKSGALQIEWRSDLAWGKTRAKDSSMNTKVTLRKNIALLKSRHPGLTDGKNALTETRSVRDSMIDYRERDPLIKRIVTCLCGTMQAVSWLTSRKWHSLKVRMGMKKD